MMIGAHLGRGRVPVFAVVYERSVVHRIGVDLDSRELFVHYRPQNPPASPNAPRKGRSSEVHELAGAGEVDGSRQGAGAAPNRPLVRPRLANMVADPGSVVDRVYSRTPNPPPSPDPPRKFPLSVFRCE